MAAMNRRDLFLRTAGIGLAAGIPGVATARAATRRKGAMQGRPPPSTAPGWQYGPFDSIRDYVAELERRGLVLRIPRIDHDAYEATALMYRLIDRFGLYNTPALIFEEVKINGRWVRGPVIANQYGHYFSEAVSLGMEPSCRASASSASGSARRARRCRSGSSWPSASAWPRSLS